MNHPVADRGEVRPRHPALDPAEQHVEGGHVVGNRRCLVDENRPLDIGRRETSAIGADPLERS